MWTSQVYGHHDKMARTKTHRTSQNLEYTKMQQTLRNNYFFVFLSKLRPIAEKIFASNLCDSIVSTAHCFYQNTQLIISSF